MKLSEPDGGVKKLPTPKTRAPEEVKNEFLLLVPESMDGRPFFKKNLIAMEKNKKMAGGNFPALSGM